MTEEVREQTTRKKNKKKKNKNTRIEVTLRDDWTKVRHSAVTTIKMGLDVSKIL